MSEYLGFEPSTNPVYFFLSYNSEDKDRIRDIAKTMMHSGKNGKRSKRKKSRIPKEY